MVITSKSNQLIKTILQLSEKKYRKLLGLYIVEGIKPVNECIKAGCEIERIVCTQERAVEYPDASVVSDAVFKSVSEEKTPQGVLAVVKIPVTKIEPPEGNCLLLDCLQDPGNLGTIIRCANAAGYESVYLINCTDPYSPKAVRASMSGIFFVDIRSGTRSACLRGYERRGHIFFHSSRKILPLYRKRGRRNKRGSCKSCKIHRKNSYAANLREFKRRGFCGNCNVRIKK